jgi:hypothetical protein
VASLSRPRHVLADVEPLIFDFTSWRFGSSVQRSHHQPHIDFASSWDPGKQPKGFYILGHPYPGMLRYSPGPKEPSFPFFPTRHVSPTSPNRHVSFILLPSRRKIDRVTSTHLYLPIPSEPFDPTIRPKSTSKADPEHHPEKQNRINPGRTPTSLIRAGEGESGDVEWKGRRVAQTCEVVVCVFLSRTKASHGLQSGRPLEQGFFFFFGLYNAASGKYGQV